MSVNLRGYLLLDSNDKKFITYLVVYRLVGLGDRFFKELWKLGEKHCLPKPGRVGEGEEHPDEYAGRFRCSGASWETIRPDSGLLASICSD